MDESLIDILRPSIEDGCYVATMKVNARIERLAAEAHDQIHRDFTRSRVALGLKRVIKTSMPYRLPPRFTCPDCGGRVLVEIDEWTTGDRIVTPGGFTAMCEPDTDAMLSAWERDEDYLGHRPDQSEWIRLHSRIGRWLVRNVEVAR